MLAVALIAVSIVGGGDDNEASGGAATTGSTTGTQAPPKLDTTALEAIAGVPQAGLVLGNPNARAVIVEYADLQCPFCAQFSRTTLPELVDKWVRPGKATIEFRGLAALGPDSTTALRFVLAAAERDKAWSAVELLYGNQGEENSGWVTDALLRAVATELDLDPAAMVAAAHGTRYDAVIEEMRTAAEADGVDGTPFFLVGRRGGTTVPVAKGAVAASAFDQALGIVTEP